MRALRLYGAHDVRIDEIPEPETRPGTVKVKVAWAGICGSDLHQYARPAFPADFVHPLFGEPGPFVLGHEFSGRVVDVAADVDGVPLGALVAVEPLIADGTCAACLRGDYHLCERFGFIGLMGGGGGMSEYVVVPAAKAHVLPAGVDAETGALVEPLSVAWHAVRRGGLGTGGTALVVGAGPIGLGLLLAAKARGAASVAVSEMSAARKRLAAALGADLVLDPADDDVVARVRAAVPGGVDAGFEASGAGRAAVGALLGSVRKGGTAVTVAQGRTAEFDPNLLMLTEIGYTGSFAYNGPDFPAVLAALADGRLRTEGLVSDRLSLDEVREKGYEELLAYADGHVKILVGIDPGA
ncbi:alcohol dehydrogenase catalytic domain-containing protein [Streptomyces sp. P6-2-1]|uniref:alcohol dehydrogenase catalytic domain-containing protein n=1 Tax=Streptomyces sp. P6-2-1 TaxID=3422591 RepID=UPI003D3618A7